MSVRHIICLPTFGSPYLVATVEHRNTDSCLKALQKAVGGNIAQFPRKEVRLHPMFCEESARWRMAQQMMTSAQTKVWVNEDGIAECSTNMATIITNPQLHVGGCPHLFGDICLDVTDNAFKVMGFRPESFELVEECFEPEDEEETAAKMAECSAKGYDFIESTGMIYKAVC